MTVPPDAAPVSQTAQLYDKLRRAILTLELAPGERISERGLEARFHASRTPVRAALFRLEREGLVLRTGRTWTVAPIDLDEIVALTEFRLILEPAMIRNAVHRAERAAIAAVRARLNELRPAPDAGAGVRAGSTFHLDVAGLGGNRFVLETLDDAMTRLERSRWLEVRTPEARDAAWREHSAILDAIEAGDGEAAEALVIAHVRGTNERLLAFLAQERRRLRGAGLAIIGEPEAAGQR